MVSRKPKQRGRKIDFHLQLNICREKTALTAFRGSAFPPAQPTIIISQSAPFSAVRRNGFRRTAGYPRLGHGLFKGVLFSPVWQVNAWKMEKITTSGKRLPEPFPKGDQIQMKLRRGNRVVLQGPEEGRDPATCSAENAKNFNYGETASLRGKDNKHDYPKRKGRKNLSRYMSW